MRQPFRRPVLKTAALTVSAILATWTVAAAAAGDIERGKQLFAVCAACHGPNAEGMQEMNAPALAGREEWYLKRQLANFKSGIRGGDSRDTYGRQMAPMAQILQDDQAIADVAAYLSSLK
jgi:cytochrome c oxidase subunit II